MSLCCSKQVSNHWQSWEYDRRLLLTLRRYHYHQFLSFTWYRSRYAEPGQDVQWCWVTESLPKVTLDSVLRCKVDLLEQLWNESDAPSPVDLPPCGLVIKILSQKRRASTVHHAVAGAVLRGCGRCVREVLPHWCTSSVCHCERK